MNVYLSLQKISLELAVKACDQKVLTKNIAVPYAPPKFIIIFLARKDKSHCHCARLCLIPLGVDHTDINLCVLCHVTPLPPGLLMSRLFHNPVTHYELILLPYIGEKKICLAQIPQHIVNHTIWILRELFF
jgi:hypothetical protein